MKKETKQQLRTLATAIAKILPDEEKEKAKQLNLLISKAWEETTRDKDRIQQAIDSVKRLDQEEIDRLVKTRVNEIADEQLVPLRQELIAARGRMDEMIPEWEQAQQRLVDALMDFLADKSDYAGIENLSICYLGDTLKPEDRIRVVLLGMTEVLLGRQGIDDEQTILDHKIYFRNTPMLGGRKGMACLVIDRAIQEVHRRGD